MVQFRFMQLTYSFRSSISLWSDVKLCVKRVVLNESITVRYCEVIGVRRLHLMTHFSLKALHVWGRASVTRPFPRLTVLSVMQDGAGWDPDARWLLRRRDMGTEDACHWPPQGCVAEGHWGNPHWWSHAQTSGETRYEHMLLSRRGQNSLWWLIWSVINRLKPSLIWQL